MVVRLAESSCGFCDRRVCYDVPNEVFKRHALRLSVASRASFEQQRMHAARSPMAAVGPLLVLPSQAGGGVLSTRMGTGREP